MDAIGGFPVNAILCGLLAALSVMLIVANRTPVVAGLNVTVKVQLALAGRVPPQLFEGLVVTVKSAGLAPTTVITMLVKLAVPEFVSVTF